MTTPRRKRIVILGAAGRDFHHFNMRCRDDPSIEVVAFTAAQIPGIARRRYPAELAGPLYPDGIAIEDEGRLEALCRDHGVDEVVFAYSDVSHLHVMHLASRAVAAGADFVVPSARRTMIDVRVPVIAIGAVRTGCGKSQVARYLSRFLRDKGLRVGVLRHPMPYGALARQAVQRLASLDDLARAECSVEEREEYEPHIAAGNIVFAGVDYARIAEAAAAEADVLIWDGGNNDLPFLRPGLLIVLVDPLRPGDELAYHPGEAALRLADVVVMAKTNVAATGDIETVLANVGRVNPAARIVHGQSLVTLDDRAAVAGKRVLVVEDGPTLTHGGMSYGAGYVAARAAGAVEIVDARQSAAGEIRRVFHDFPHIDQVLPAVGYDADQLRDLAATIAASAADVVVSATPCDLSALISIDKPVVRALYEYANAPGARLEDSVERFIAKAMA